MPRMRVRHVGPIRQGREDNDGWLEMTKVTVFVGNERSGRCTLAKLFATFAWIEKALVRGDYEKKWFERKNRLQNQFLAYHRLQHYLPSEGKDPAMIEYQGDAYSITFSDGYLEIEEAQPYAAYELPQIMYVPAERNFISYVRHPQELKLSSDALKEFLSEFEKAKAELRGRLPLPINGAELEYDKLNDALSIHDDAYKLRLTDASSGFQSAVPLFLVSCSLAYKREADRNLLERLSKVVVPLDALVDGRNVSIYQSDETTGSIQKLATTEGIPSDRNYLNVQLMKGNELFDQLLDIEEELSS